MSFVREYLLPRVFQYLLVTFLGLSAAFILPRLMPINPVQQKIAQYQSFGVYIPPEQRDAMIQTLKELYGLEGTLLEQYVAFWKRLLRGDFGPSLAQFPTPVMELVSRHLPWTLGLLALTTLLGWVLGTLVGGIAGYYARSKWTQLLDGIAMFVRPIPYYILSLLLLLFLAYVFPIFPLGGGAGVGVQLTLNLRTIRNILHHAALPALTLIIAGGVTHFQAMKLIVQSVRSEDYVSYAKAAGIDERRIAFRYVIRNAMLPTITQLGLSFGFVFSGALITEMVFAYPGIGWVLYNAVMNGDYNLIMAIACISVVAITTSVFVLDLLYPLVDPRVRYR
ncbi:MAG: ABC transporter permease [Candidatus Caldatribacterium sp.]|uniref:ABC transporter permease n=1 Tax=Candidatus Caldatribacterium sp. TaxID=2282143 RepID=UPI002993CABF|nr:ABC transporter permease [Candidatus Caldatribacterium sp.]MCX7730595.1 ABC transporter permease [Candidatus Caldatribacterium sp.]MDW8081635.1 ABC transporter permease [Candidatus Calescibacterium sp.]